MVLLVVLFLIGVGTFATVVLQTPGPQPVVNQRSAPPETSSQDIPAVPEDNPPHTGMSTGAEAGRPMWTWVAGYIVWLGLVVAVLIQVRTRRYKAPAEEAKRLTQRATEGPGASSEQMKQVSRI